MKNLLTTFGTLVIMLCTITSCEKTEQMVETETEQILSIDIQLQPGRGEASKAILIGTEKALEEALLHEREGHIFLKRLSTTNNIFAPVVGPFDPSPVEFCWQAAQDFYDANIEAWQQQANRTCKNVSYCFECGGLAVLFDITPNSAKCLLAEASLEMLYEIRKFNFSPGEYHGATVSSFINSK